MNELRQLLVIKGFTMFQADRIARQIKKKKLIKATIFQIKKEGK